MYLQQVLGLKKNSSCVIQNSITSSNGIAFLGKQKKIMLFKPTASIFQGMNVRNF